MKILKYINLLFCSIFSFANAQQRSAYELNLDLIEENQASQKRWKLDVNEFVGLSDLEFTKNFKGYKLHFDPERHYHEPITETPTSFSWVDKGVINPIKNQQSCGSCWAFSAVGALEPHIRLKTKKPIVLSEQEFVDCVKNIKDPLNVTTCCSGCEGGEPYSVFQFLIEKENGKDDTAVQYPYTAIEGDCDILPTSAGIKLKGYVNLPQDEDIIQNALFNHGPISVAVNANQDWQLYSKGIYDPSDEECSNSVYDLDHAVVLVGFGTEEGLDYWLIRNSWGEAWGENGYIRLTRGSNACGIANQAMYPILHNKETSPESLSFPLVRSIQLKTDPIQGKFCGSILGLISDIEIIFNKNFNFNISANVFGKTLTCSNEIYTFNKSTSEIFLSNNSDCLSNELKNRGIHDLRIFYQNSAIELNIEGESFLINSCSSFFQACHDNCGNSCLSGPCGSCSNLCCACGCNTCHCCS